ncbi:hypothetical protein M1384_03270 [Candidatus Parvarchaeota archaeon]|jgi:hypothetical protein|nr:hypothetical protein [Candidatus Parvarchaeota archaeon]
MVEEKKFHSVLSSTAVKLSVYSSFLDFGLAISVFFLQRKLLPFAMTSFLLNLFDTAIAYLTFAIIGLFLAAMALKFRERIITITPHAYKAQNINVRKVKVSLPKENFNENRAKTAILKVKPEAANQQIQRVVTKNKQDFIKFNGVWYKVAKDKFDKVARPDY